ncbi:CD83 antigen [Dicentrarchus labrax]|uniref:Ig-like domain-containing protein n=1 Tax=Dicentrarchus labrax TaxID=13489 RepID=A0A8P4G785_DICLA|nr:CD83 antigen [Dicentrarchus labrax]
MCAGLLNLVVLLSLFVCLAVGMAVSEELLQIKSVSGADCRLQCTAVSQPGVQYRAVRWYKVRDPPSPSRLSGLLTKDLPNGPTRWYTSVDQAVQLVNNSSTIFLPNVTCGESGVYECHLAAPVGQQNREGRVRLTLTDCPEICREIVMTDTYMVIVATAVLMFALVVFIISYVCLRNTIKGKNKTTVKETLLDAPLKPLEKKDLMLIYTLGPNSGKMKHICV